MTERVRQFIEREGLLRQDSLCLVAISGGADSVCLLLMLKQLGYRVEAAHCNFHLRGDESLRDEEFVRTLCQKHSIPLHITNFDTNSYASLHKVGIEMAARELRYGYFEQLRTEIGAEAVCVAHHRDDSVETVLMNLLRCTGIQGMAGIRPRNGHVVRPLLCLSRQEIEAYLNSRGQDYVTDSTNLVPDIVRNQVRLRLIPLLKEINPAAVENIARSAHHLAEAGKVYRAAVDEALTRLTKAQTSGFRLQTSELLREPSPESLLFELMRRYGFTSEQVAAVYSQLESPTTGRVYSSASHDLLIDRGQLILEERGTHAHPLPPSPSGTQQCLPGQETLRYTITPGSHISRDSRRATLDADKVALPLTLRTVRQGDRFVPFGMTGSRLVSDFLTDRKRTLFEKRRQLVVTDANGQIVWLVGERTDNRCRVTPATRRTLLLEIIPA